MNLTSCSDQPFGDLMWFARDDSHECMPVLDTHEVVEDGVECGREVVEEPREVHEVLIDSPVDMTVPEVDIAMVRLK